MLWKRIWCSWSNAVRTTRPAVRRRRIEMALVSWAAKVLDSERVETVYDTVVGVGRLMESIVVEAASCQVLEA